jgi:hypothetical protein
MSSGMTIEQRAYLAYCDAVQEWRSLTFWQQVWRTLRFYVGAQP